MKSLLPLTLILMSTSALAVDPIDQYQGGQIVILKAQVTALQSQIDTLVATAGEAEKTFQFVGISSMPLDGNKGMRPLHEACAADFPGSRMCFSREVVNTATYPAGDSTAHGFVHPSFVADGADIRDISGRYPGSCDGWSGSGTGLVV